MLKVHSVRSRIRHAIDPRVLHPRRAAPAGVLAPYAASGARHRRIRAGRRGGRRARRRAMAIGRLAIGRARIRRLEIDRLVVRKLHVVDDLHAPTPSSSGGATSGVTR